MASHRDQTGEPVVTQGGAYLPPLLVMYNEETQGFCHGAPIKVGHVYSKYMAEATLVQMEGKGHIVGVGRKGKFGLIRKATKADHAAKKAAAAEEAS